MARLHAPSVGAARTRAGRPPGALRTRAATPADAPQPPHDFRVVLAMDRASCARPARRGVRLVALAGRGSSRIRQSPRAPWVLAFAEQERGQHVLEHRFPPPAVPTQTVTGPDGTSLGRNARRWEPNAVSSASAAPTSAAANTAVRCCRNRPGFLRPAWIFSITKGRPVTREGAAPLPFQQIDR